MIYAIAKQIPGKLLFYTATQGRNFAPIFIEQGRIRVYRDYPGVLAEMRELAKAKSGVLLLKTLNMPWTGEHIHYPSGQHPTDAAYNSPTGRFDNRDPVLQQPARRIPYERSHYKAMVEDAAARASRSTTASTGGATIPYLISQLGATQTIAVLANEIRAAAGYAKDEDECERMIVQANILKRIAEA